MLLSGPAPRTPDIDFEAAQTSMAAASSRIKLNDTVLLQLPTREVKAIKIDLNKVNLGKFGTFNGDSLIGHPYGYSYEIAEKELRVLPPSKLDDVEDTSATNEFIDDTKDTQIITHTEIEAMKVSGAHASEIIQRQISQHTTFTLKTEYSKDKYIKRKTAKFSKSFTILEPTVYNICEYWFNKDPSRIRYIRVDALAQMLSLANVAPGGRVLVVDDASGLIIASVLDRLGGCGRIFSICDLESQPVYHVVQYLNGAPNLMDPVVSLNWATADKDFVIPDDETETQLVNERQKTRTTRRKMALTTLIESRKELFEGNFDSLIVATQYDAFSIIERLFDYLAGSAQIVVHSPYPQQACGWQMQMKEDPRFLAPSVLEPWLRKYQVLPGRTHPTMTTTGSGGYILHATKVLV